MTAPTHTAFLGQRLLARGSLAEVALAVKHADADASALLIFEDHNGRQIDLDTRGSDQQVQARHTPAADQPRGRGRPKLGVTAREVTLLPRHWQWLNAQPGGASVTLRKLVENARREDTSQARERRDAAYRFMSAMAGDQPGFEEAARALYAGQHERLQSLTGGWPEDVRDHLERLISGPAPNSF
ncbi:DUF2239 family protein [Alloalcanivorax mobilis]|uniref:DUF2239 family protein n=1 Tax=Alloalcanivorax mobilis TaxID=2019569 RepID=UPI000C776B2F|nr:DUF2239 family protein [Alloalcanivorax mobilis]